MAAVVWRTWFDQSARVPASGITNRPIEDPSNGYVGSDACRDCHAHEHATWHASYHRTMTQIATPESMIGDFDRTLSLGGVSFHLARHGDQFSFHARRPRESTMGRQVVQAPAYPIVMTTGSHHMQICWYSLGDDTRVLGMLPFTYLKQDQRCVYSFEQNVEIQDLRYSLDMPFHGFALVLC